jgi:TIR domain
MRPAKGGSGPKVFLSHSHADREFVVDIQNVIERYGAATYLDQDRIQAADVLPDRIRTGIEWCNVFLLFWSGAASRSHWVRNEWEMAYELRRKIIPYCLDSSSLPPGLDNLVYIERRDATFRHGALLKALFGRDFAPPATELFPGRWQVVLNAYGMGTATYVLDLRGNGQISGTGGIDPGGVLDRLLGSQGMEALLRTRSSVTGDWSYEEGTEMLTVNLVAHGMGQDFSETIQIRMTGHESGEIRGQDFSGRSYSIKRLSAAAGDRVSRDDTSSADRRRSAKTSGGATARAGGSTHQFSRGICQICGKSQAAAERWQWPCKS